MAASRLYASLPPRVSHTNSGVVPKGSRTTSSVTKALNMSSSTVPDYRLPETGPEGPCVVRRLSRSERARRSASSPSFASLAP